MEPLNAASRGPDRVNQAQLVRLGVTGRDRPYRGKRLFDLALLAVVAVPALLVALVCALAIRLTSRGPVVYSQQRVGLGEREFHIYKFRTMVLGQNPDSPELNRSTRVGRWLKRSSLDELPQLINVLKGDMSIVGPRPTFPYQVERYEKRQRRRHAVRPGLTGLAQVRGRNTLTWAERIEHDLEYVDHQSPALDLRILLDTLRTLRSGEGAEGHPPGDPIAADPDPATEAGRREIARRRQPLP
ncbi:MAG: hypothetical protein JJLCMIEE_02197 [Acidimicrobiales bacterium]|nr:MAG: sugar transferase [Actinomycetota bacterium]MBV6509129.1 hypothetical protein [Acidimicrobiales bacterium]RIK08520.1 MAG: sugar transferase [Acidobacteriota bacterium]